MTDLVFTEQSYDEMRTSILADKSQETCIILSCAVARHSDGFRLLVRKIHYLPAEAYLERSGVRVSVSADTVATLAKQARLNGRALVFAHSHLGLSGRPIFSPADDEGERPLAKFLDSRVSGLPHGALVVSSSGCNARRLATNERYRILTVGEQLQDRSATSATSIDSVFDRQVRAFGKTGQAVIERLKIAVIGLGGTGSIVAQELAHLGVRHFLLIDPDHVEHSNLNRLVGASHADQGQSKVQIAKRHINSISPNAAIEAVADDVVRIRTARKVIDSDLIFCCTDSHGSRAVLGQLAYQYFIPCIDMGVTIGSHGGNVKHISGRVQLLAPGLPCLVCSGKLDSEAVRRDLMTAEENQSDPYFIGPGEPQPSVISINGVVASLAVTMFLGVVTDIPARARHQIVDAIAGTVRAATGASDRACLVCSEQGSLGRADEWSLPTRND